METLIIHTEGEKLKAIKQLLKAMEVAFETKKEESPYDPDFVKMVKESAAEKGGRVIDPKNIWKVSSNPSAHGRKAFKPAQEIRE